jgi:cytochrome P450
MLLQLVGFFFTLLTLWVTYRIQTSANSLPNIALKLGKRALNFPEDPGPQLPSGLYQGYAIGLPVISVRNGEYIDDVLRRMDDFEIMTDLPTFRLFFDHSIFGHNGEEWRRHRLALNSGLKQNSHNEMMKAKYVALVTGWMEVVQNHGSNIGICNYVRHASFSIMVKFAYGVDISVDPDDPEAKELYGLFHDCLQALEPNPWIDLLGLDLRYLTPFSDQAKKAVTARDKLGAFCLRLLHEREANLHEDQIDMLSLLLRDRPEGFDDEDMIGAMISMFFAGHDTVSSAIIHTLWYLARHNNSQLDVLREVLKAGGKLTAATCPTLHACILESLRLSGPAAFGVLRKAKTDTTLGGAHISAGTFINCCLHAGNRNGYTWEKPEEFDPTRFLKLEQGVVKLDSKAAAQIYSFGGGKRSCLGKTISIHQMVIAVASIVEAFQFRLPADSPYWVRLAYRSTTGVLSPVDLILNLDPLP